MERKVVDKAIRGGKIGARERESLILGLGEEKSVGDLRICGGVKWRFGEKGSGKECQGECCNGIEEQGREREGHAISHKI